MANKRAGRTRASSKLVASDLRVISFDALMRRASQDRQFFRRIMTNPEVTLAREGLSLSAKNRQKLIRIREIVRGEVSVQVTPATVRRALKPLRAVAAGDWDIDWRFGWRAAEYAPSAIAGVLRFRNVVD